MMDSKNPVVAEEINEAKSHIEKMRDELKEHPKAGAQMSLGIQMYVDKLFKVSKAELHQAFSEYSLDLVRSINNTNEETIKKFNDFNGELQKKFLSAIEKTDKKFSGLYGALVNQFLVKIEQRVWGTEVCYQAMSEIIAEKLHFIHTQTMAAGSAGSFEEFKKNFDTELETRINIVSERIVKEMEEKAKADAEKKNAELEANKQQEKQDGSVAEEAIKT